KVRDINAYLNSLNVHEGSSVSVSLNTVDKARQKLPVSSQSGSGLSYPEYYASSVAIIGISCRLPGAEDYRQFWRNLVAGEESVRFYSKQELYQNEVDERLINNRNFVPVQSTIDCKGLFDPDFFQISPKDSELIDPQLRLLLQHSWKAIED